MDGSSYRIATVWGIPIRIHISLIILLTAFAVSIGLEGGLEAIALLMALEIGVFTSIALHELGHSFVALRKGCRVRDITLMFIGGAAQMEEIPRRPWDEFQMAVAGPVVSVLLGLALWFGGLYLPLRIGLWPLPLTRHLGIRCNLIQFLGVINIGLAVFNLLPAFPMDGGRVLRALLVRRMGRLRATRIAARIGKLMAAIFAVWGIASLPGGWIMLFIAFFLYSAGSREYKMVLMQESMEHGPYGGPPFGGWPFGGGGWRRRPPPRGDRVIISPPPYKRGPNEESEIRPDDE